MSTPSPLTAHVPAISLALPPVVPMSRLDHPAGSAAEAGPAQSTTKARHIPRLDPLHMINLRKLKKNSASILHSINAATLYYTHGPPESCQPNFMVHRLIWGSSSRKAAGREFRGHLAYCGQELVGANDDSPLQRIRAIWGRRCRETLRPA